MPVVLLLITARCGVLHSIQQGPSQKASKGQACGLRTDQQALQGLGLLLKVQGKEWTLRPLAGACSQAAH